MKSTFIRRWLPILIGLLMISLVWIIRWDNYIIPQSSPAKDRLLMMLVGIFFLFFGIADRKFISCYRGCALILINTGLLLVFLELAASCAVHFATLFTSFGKPFEENYLHHSYYVNQTWSAQYWNEAEKSVKLQYQPYSLFKSQQFQGQWINVNKETHRVVPETRCGDGSYKVFMFGGSTMWGYGSPDWGTIPAYLQQAWNKAKKNVCVINYGTPAYVSTQSVIRLELELQQGNTPDLVIFYDGINDIYASYQSGQAGVHHNLSEIEQKLENPGVSSLTHWIKQLTVLAITNRFIKPPVKNYVTIGVDSVKLATATIDVYLGNYQIVEALSKQYQFEFVFFWQPTLPTDKKTLTAEEKEILETFDPSLITLYRQSYALIETRQSNYPYLHNIEDSFSAETQSLWIDWTHITPEGNKIIAARIWSILDR